MPEKVALAKKGIARKPGHARWTLCTSHAKRKAFSKLCFDAAASGERLSVRYSDEFVSECFVGCPLIGNTTAKDVVNAVFYQVQGWSETRGHIADLDSGEEFSVALDHMRYLRIGFAITMAAVQGRTLRARTRIWDCDHRNFTTRHLAMAIGRVTRPEDLDFA